MKKIYLLAFLGMLLATACEKTTVDDYPEVKNPINKSKEIQNDSVEKAIIQKLDSIQGEEHTGSANVRYGDVKC